MRRILLFLLILLSAPCCAATYKLVTDASELKDGDVIIIGADNDLVMSLKPLNKNSSLDAIHAFSFNNDIFNPLDSTIEFTLAATDGKWYLKSGDKFLGAKSKSSTSDKYLSLVTSASAKDYSTTASISIDASTHYASIVFSNEMEIYLSSSHSFRCMSNPSYKTVKVFKKVDEQPSLVGSSEYCSNEKALAEWKNQTKIITLYRSFVADGGYYTLCLPFDVNQEQLKTIFGENTETYTFSHATTENGDYNVYLSAENRILTAGTPYIIKPSQSVTNPVFKNVTIKAIKGIKVTINQVSFNGILDPFNLNKDNKLQRFLGGSNGLTLLYPNAESAIYPTRAYFDFPSASKAKIGFSDATLNGLDQVNAPSCTAKSYFTLDGRMLENKPTHDGIYIMDGHKVILHKR